MYVKNGIAYASSETDIIEVQSVKPLEDFMMLLTFTSGEVRLYDVSPLLQFPAFAPLSQPDIFAAAKVEDGIAPETMYRDSYP